MNRANRGIISAMVLGDGNLTGNTLSLAHSVAQLDYLEWKVNLVSKLINFGPVPKIKEKKYVFPNKIYFGYRADLRCKYFKYFRRWAYPNNRKSPIKILRFIRTPLDLAIWFMDDGSVNKAKKKHKDGSVYFLRPTVTLATHSFTEDEANLILRHFKDMFNISGYINWERKRSRPNNPKYPRLWFNGEESEKLWRLIKPYMPSIKSMYMKFGFIHQWYSKKDLEYKTLGME